MIELRTFGRLELTSPDGREVRAILVHPKRTALLVYLALAQPRGFQRRDALLPVFWPELDQDRARAALRKALHHLRRALGADILETRGDEEVRLAENLLWCDAAAFEASLANGDPGRAVELFQGSFLEAFFAPDAPEFERWMERERSRLHRRAFDAAWQLAEADEKQGNRFGAAHWGRKAAALSPDDEGALRRLMRLLDGLGDRAGAVQAYEGFSRRIKTELDIDPSAETQALARAIRSASVVASESVEGGAPTRGEEKRERRRQPARSARLRPLALTLAAALIVSGSWTGLKTAGPPATISPQVVAVFPFQLLGDPSFEYLTDGLASLLSTGLDGAGEMRSLDPQIFVRAPAGSHTWDLGNASSAAAEFGAGLLVLGDVVASGPGIRVSASIYDASRPNRKVGSANAQGPADSLFSVVDQLAAQLIAAQQGAPARAVSRLAALTTHSIPALKAYLEGEREFEKGTFPRAIAGYQHAIALDSTFALAYYRLAQAYTWSSVDSSRAAAEQAARLSERLPAPERELVEAFLYYERGEPDEAERRYREILRRRPEEVDAFFNLGEVLFHYNPDRGRPVTEARELFARALAFNDGEAPLIHLLEITALDREYRTFDSLIPLIEPGSHFWLTGRMVHAFELGTERERQEVEDQLGRASDRELATVGVHALFLVEDGNAALRVVRALDHPSRQAETRLIARLFRAHLLLAGGRWREARQALDSAGLIDPVRAAEHAGLLFSTPFLPFPRPVLEQVRAGLEGMRPPAFVRRGTLYTGEDQIHGQLLDYVRGMLDARLGRFEQALIEAQALERLSGSFAVVGQTLAGGIRAYVGILGNRAAGFSRGFRQPGWTLSSADLSAYSPFPGLRHERFILAESLARSGRLDQAVGWLSTFAEHSAFGRVYLAPSLYRRGELLETMGRPGEAAAAYLRFSRLWQDADAEFQPLVTEAKRRATRLAPEVGNN